LNDGPLFGRYADAEKSRLWSAKMKDRFAGETGRRILLEALKDQKLLAGNAELADQVASIGELIDVPTGTAIIEQGADDNDVYFVLAGSFNIVVNNRVVAGRFPGDHVGEMVAIQPTQRRSATVVAREDAVVVKLPEPQFAELAAKYPQMLLYIAKELARRLEQRNALVTSVSERIRVFIISSAEAIEIARTIQNGFDHDPFAVTVWTDGVFRASHYAIESLERALDQSDVAIAVAQPDDITESRGQLRATPRDNVIFELGFFMGRLGRHRALLVEPRGEEISLPSDLAGINTITYRYDAADLTRCLATACNRLREIIRDLGPNR
jgi:CRP/FNR family transcriptional regulator, cyclic AMP receptor protein